MVEKIKDYLRSKLILIIDPSSNSMSQTIQVLKEFGIAVDQIHQAKTFHVAREIMRSEQPGIIISEYNIGHDYSLHMFAEYNREFPTTEERMFVVLTANSQDSAVAAAAEEDVDFYLLKPYSIKTLKEKFIRALVKKVNPDPYNQKIYEGKGLMLIGEIDKARGVFEEATQLDEAPCLALYHLGKCYEQSQEYDKALSSYDQALALKDNHYRSLLARFDLLDRMGKKKEAYDCVKIISELFPLGPQRLGRMFTLAIQTQNFDDIPNLYEIYLKLDHRPQDLIKNVTQGLLVHGAFLLKQGAKDDAIKAFKNGVAASERDEAYIMKVVELLLKEGLGDEGLDFLSMLSPDQKGSQQYTVLDFKARILVIPKEQLIEKGRQLLMNGKADPEIARWTIESMIELGYAKPAERAIDNAINLFPNMRAEFLKLADLASEDTSLGKAG